MLFPLPFLGKGGASGPIHSLHLGASERTTSDFFTLGTIVQLFRWPLYRCAYQTKVSKMPLVPRITESLR